MVAAEIFVAAAVALAAVVAAAVTLLLKPQYSSSTLCLVMSVGPFISCLQRWPATYILSGSCFCRVPPSSGEFKLLAKTADPSGLARVIVIIFTITVLFGRC